MTLKGYHEARKKNKGSNADTNTNNNYNDNDKTRKEKPNTYYNPQLYIPKGVFQSHFEHSEVKFKKSIPNQR